jgi:hypothetical protein
MDVGDIKLASHPIQNQIAPTGVATVPIMQPRKMVDELSNAPQNTAQMVQANVGHAHNKNKIQPANSVDMKI